MGTNKYVVFGIELAELDLTLIAPPITRRTTDSNRPDQPHDDQPATTTTTTQE
jgi:hypothetical protein